MSTVDEEQARMERNSWLREQIGKLELDINLIRARMRGQQAALQYRQEAVERYRRELADPRSLPATPHVPGQ